MTKMTPLQSRVIALCLIVNALDGFDVLAMSFAAPLLAKAWSLDNLALGTLLSMGLAGMVVGSMLLAPLSDVIGRKRMILVSLLILTLGMIGAACTQNATQLGVLRLFTGLGIGAMIPALNTMSAEYAPPERRAFAVSLMAVGYPIGTTVGGLFCVVLLGWFDWRAIFVFGACASAVMIPIIWKGMPESADFLSTRQTSRVNVVSQVLRPELRMQTLLVCSCYFMAMLSFYFLLSWTPKMLVDQGYSVRGGISGSMLMSLGGVVGGVLLGSLMRRHGVQRLTATVMCGVLVFVVLFGFGAQGIAMKIAVALLIGFCLFGAVVGMYAMIAAVYPPAVRTIGAGLAVGVGRLGAVLAPLIGGYLLNGGHSQAATAAILATPMLLAAFLVTRVRATY
jgi:benzoate transport